MLEFLIFLSRLPEHTCLLDTGTSRSCQFKATGRHERKRIMEEVQCKINSAFGRGCHSGSRFRAKEFHFMHGA